MRYRVAGVQMPVAFADPDANLASMEQRLRETAAEGAHLTVFPECAVSGYCFDSLEEAWPYAEPIPGPSCERMAALCAELNVFAIFGLLEAGEQRMFNACVLVGPEGLVGSYRKIHLPYLGIDRFTTPGDRPFQVHDAGGLRVGMHICYDGAFPESARVLALLGADLLVLPTNWPPGAECTADYVINSRAMENQVYYLAVNRIGTERNFRFIGRSKFCNPSGEPLATLLHEDPGVVWAEVDVAWARNKHIVRVPGLHEIDRFNDRRPDMYGPITQ